MFQMEVNTAKKVFTIIAAGFFTMEEGQKFAEEYQTKVKTFAPQDYSLIVDGKDVKPSSPEVADALQGVMGMYLSVPFKKRYIVKLSSVVAQSQVQRLGKQVPGFDQIEFVDSVQSVRL